MIFQDAVLFDNFSAEFVAQIQFFRISSGIGMISLRKLHASLRYLGKTTGGHFDSTVGLLRVRLYLGVPFNFIASYSGYNGVWFCST